MYLKAAKSFSVCESHANIILPLTVSFKRHIKEALIKCHFDRSGEILPALFFYKSAYQRCLHFGRHDNSYLIRGSLISCRRVLFCTLTNLTENFNLITKCCYKLEQCLITPDSGKPWRDGDVQKK
jgi:hypothetical protein